MAAIVEPLLTSLRDRIAREKDLAGRELISLVRPSIRLKTERVPFDRIAIGDSRLGGVPDVPPGFEWPRWLPASPRDDKYGSRWRPESPVPLGFIAQIDLSAMPRVDDSLPRSGWLYFFYDRYCEPWGYDPADRGSCRVIYADCDRSRLVRAEPPIDLDPEHGSEVCQVEARPELTLPNDLPELELECQLASHGINCGGAEEYECDEAKVLEAGAADWRLLLQIDSDDEASWMWGDGGRIYFWIKQQDLRLPRFDDVWLILQCS